MNLIKNSILNKLFITAFVILAFSMQVFAEEITFDNETFELKFSAKSPLSGGYMNEYIAFLTSSVDGEAGSEKKEYLEYNIFKFEQYKDGGLVGFQFAKRYYLADGQDIKDAKKYIEKNQDRLMKAVISQQIPEVIQRDI